jgi:hypothetical protein
MGQFDIEIPRASITDISTSMLTDRQAWADMTDVFNTVMEANVDGPIQQLEYIRFLPPDADPKILAEVCRLLGFDLSQDLLNMSLDKFTQLASQLGKYPDTNGTEEFTKFISLMTNGNCSVEYLWTQDYINFYPEPRGALLIHGGSWFKTTHVDLNMGFSTLAGLQLQPGQTLGQKIVEIFYQQAPATLVIERQTFTVSMQCQDIGFNVQVADVERVYEIQCAG